MKTVESGFAIEQIKSVEEFEPLWDFCVLEVPEVRMTEGGIAIPETVEKGYQDTKRGRCVKAGPGAYRDSGELVPNPIKVGDIVYFMSYKTPFVLNVGKAKYYILSGRDVVGIVPRKET